MVHEQLTLASPILPKEPIPNHHSKRLSPHPFFARSYLDPGSD